MTKLSSVLKEDVSKAFRFTSVPITSFSLSAEHYGLRGVLFFRRGYKGGTRFSEAFAKRVVMLLLQFCVSNHLGTKSIYSEL